MKNVLLEVKGDGVDIPEMNSVEGMVVTYQQRAENATSGCMSHKKLQREKDVRELSWPYRWKTKSLT
jgi:hypothetical protein